MANFKRGQARRWAENIRFQPYTIPSHRAQNPSRQAREASPDPSRAPMQDNATSLTTEEKEEHFKLLNATCNAGSRSCYHDLKCNHRIYVDYAKECGTNCKKAGPENPFVCPECIAEEVRTQMMFEGMSIVKDDDEMDDGSREQKILEIAKSKIYDLIMPASVRVEWNQHKAPKVLHRLCKSTEKFEDPKMQFFNQFSKDEGFGGINPAEDKMKPAHAPFDQHALPKMPTSTPATGPLATQPAPTAAQTSLGLQQTTWPAEHEDPNAIWCTCRQVDDGSRMLLCDNPNCQYKWYHIRCLKQEERPLGGDGLWFCPDCVDVQPPQQSEIPVVAHADNLLDDIADQMGDVRVGEGIKDDATKAVREALDTFALDDK